MIDQHDFLNLTGIEWGLAWQQQWVHGVDEEFVAFIAATHATLEDTRLRCALDLFRSFNSGAAREIAAAHCNDMHDVIRGAARGVFEAHHEQGWIAEIPAADWREECLFARPALTKRQRQRARKYGQPFAKDKRLE